MDLNYYVDKIRFQLTGGVLETELEDSSFVKIINLALQEMNRYYDSTQLVQVSAASCIDLAKVEEDNGIKISSISNVYRTNALAGAATGADGITTTTNFVDPIKMAQWNLANNAYNFGTNKWAYNYVVYNTTQQMFNTMSTDLDFKVDYLGKKLYVNLTSSASQLTIEYVPKLSDVSEVTGDYWIDILSSLALAYAKITLGRIRTRYTQSNALWTQDGEALLTEGNTELAALRERLRAQANFTYPVD